MKRNVVFFGCILWFSIRAVGQTGSDYDTLVHQGNSQLQAGSNDVALTTANTAIKLNADRWEAYALAGGALMNLKRYEDAADDFSDAIKRAPEAKQAGLRDLRKQCLLAEPGAPASPAATPAQTAQPASTTQAEIVLWKSIENSNNPSDFQTYLNQYPNGAFINLAQRHLAEAEVKVEEERKILGVPLPGTVWIGTEVYLDKHGKVLQTTPVLMFFLSSGQVQFHLPNKGDAPGIEADASRPFDELRGKYLPQNWTTGSGSWQLSGAQLMVRFTITDSYGSWPYIYNASRTGDQIEGTWSCPACKDQGPLKLRRLDPSDASIASRTVHEMWSSIFW
jgi:hypothetical protein